jgi:ADP-ribose pyrophosphatase YjhB (NUDIX family)
LRRNEAVKVQREYPKFPIVAVGALILNKDEVLLIKRRYEPGAGKWSIPGGLIELGESVEDATKREVKEEVGLDVELDCVLGVVDNIVKDKNGKVKFHYVVIDYLAHPVGGELKPSKECLDAGWFKLKDVEKLDKTRTLMKLLKNLRKIKDKYNTH